MDLVIRGGTVVLGEGAFDADVAIGGETVQELGQGLRGEQEINASGCLVLPGGVDPHTHFDLRLGPDLRTSDDFESGTVAAAHGGTTTIINFAEQPGFSNLTEALEAWRARAEGRAVLDYSFHMLVSDPRPEILEEMGTIVGRGVTSFKALLAYKDIVMLDDAQLFRLCKRARDLGALVSVHAENGHVIDELTARYRTLDAGCVYNHSLSRPDMTEAEATHRALAIAEAAAAPVYIVHMSCARAVDALRTARARGQSAFGETCPQYLLLDERLYRDKDFDQAAGYVLSPPLRRERDNKALWTALTSGTIQTVATDHCSFTLEQKSMGQGDFTQIPNGMPGVETRVPLMYHSGVRRGRLTLSQWVRAVALEPARLFGLFPAKGTLMPGSDADIVIFDPHRRQRLDAPELHQATDYSPYAGREICGWPRHVLQRGQFVIKDGIFVGRPGAGRFVPRRRFRPGNFAT